jgi:hypothetical protein
MSQASNLYSAPIDQCAAAILANGRTVTVLVQGDMGSGKSSLLTMINDELVDGSGNHTHVPCYFDCTTKDLGDIMIPNILNIDHMGHEGTPFVSFATNEELGIHLGKPIILMLDEYGKSNPAVKNALLRLMLERKVGNQALHPDSIVFATTNLGGEGVGDLLMPHQNNRITTITMRKPSSQEWIEWGINHGIEASLLGWVKDNPQLMQSFQDVADPDDNPYIFHPQEVRTSFVTPRSLEKASDILKNRDKVEDATTTGLLVGTIGDRGAMDLMSFVSMADQLPSLESIKKDPKNAILPTSAAAVCMVVYRTLSTIERDWIDAWMDYMLRLDAEAQGLFANGVRVTKYAKRSVVMTNKKFTQWALDNNHMFASDKR